MYDLDSKELGRRYDFPVIFLPRHRTNLRGNSDLKPNRYQSFDLPLDWTKNEKFFDLQMKFIPNETDEQRSLKLTDIDLNINSFEVYLEDYFIGNLVKVGIEFIGLATSGNTVCVKGFEDQDYYDSVNKELGILFEPIIMLKNIHFGKYLN